jgi:hypothetical protein
MIPPNSAEADKENCPANKPAAQNPMLADSRANCDSLGRKNGSLNLGLPESRSGHTENGNIPDSTAPNFLAGVEQQPSTNSRNESSTEEQSSRGTGAAFAASIPG